LKSILSKNKLQQSKLKSNIASLYSNKNSTETKLQQNKTNLYKKIEDKNNVECNINDLSNKIIIASSNKMEKEEIKLNKSKLLEEHKNSLNNNNKQLKELNNNLSNNFNKKITIND